MVGMNGRRFRFDQKTCQMSPTQRRLLIEAYALKFLPPIPPPKENKLQMKSYLLEAIANHLNAQDSEQRPTNEDRDYLRRLFVQHAFLLNAIESNRMCQQFVEQSMAEFIEKKRAELKPDPEEPKIIIP